MYVSAQQLIINSLFTRMSLNCELSPWQIYASFFFSLVGKFYCRDFSLLLGVSQNFFFWCLTFLFGCFVLLFGVVVAFVGGGVLRVKIN